MRPVTREKQPNGATRYDDMRPFLLVHWGKYCTYCELPIGHQPAVDHILPRDRFPEYVDLWENLLLSCSHCNSRKGAEFPTPQTLDDYLWPTKDNTARAFKYVNIFPELADGLPKEHREMARQLHDLLKLDATGDLREDERRQAYAEATKWRTRLMTAKDPSLVREAIVEIAQGKGFFSVWMAVFFQDLEMRKLLIAAFPGTARDCFNDKTEPVARPGGRM